MIGIDNSRRSVLFWSVFALACWLVVVALYFFARPAYIWLGTEDKLGENMTSVFYGAAGILVLIRVVKQLRAGKSTVARQVLPFLFALFFIFVGGEEISWGQRLFHVQTPASLAASNVQGEMNLHNLAIFDKNSSILNQHTALNLIALGLGVVLPVAHWRLKWVQDLFRRFNFPVLPLACVGWFFLGLLHSQTIAKIQPHWSDAEVKELIFSVGFFFFGISWLRNGRVE